MAGTAAGIAKANAARAMRKAERDRQRLEASRAARGQRQPNEPTTAGPFPVATLVEDRSPSLIVSADGSTAVSQPGQQLAAYLVDSAAPDAVGFIVKTMRNAKASLSMRFAAACKVVDLSMGRERGKSQGADGQLLDQVRAAVQLRQRRDEAVTVTPEREEAVTPAASPQSQQAPDS